MTSPDARGGAFYGPDGFTHLTGGPAEQKLYPAAEDRDSASRIWAEAARRPLRPQEPRRRPRPEAGPGPLIFTATPGSDSHDKRQLLSVIGAQKLRSPS